jgi:hypothetical protein
MEVPTAKVDAYPFGARVYCDGKERTAERISALINIQPKTTSGRSWRFEIARHGPIVMAEVPAHKKLLAGNAGCQKLRILEIPPVHR